MNKDNGADGEEWPVNQQQFPCGETVSTTHGNVTVMTRGDGSARCATITRDLLDTLSSGVWTGRPDRRPGAATEVWRVASGPPPLLSGGQQRLCSRRLLLQLHGHRRAWVDADPRTRSDESAEWVTGTRSCRPDDRVTRTGSQASVLVEAATDQSLASRVGAQKRTQIS